MTLIIFYMWQLRQLALAYTIRKFQGEIQIQVPLGQVQYVFHYFMLSFFRKLKEYEREKWQWRPKERPSRIICIFLITRSMICQKVYYMFSVESNLYKIAFLLCSRVSVRDQNNKRNFNFDIYVRIWIFNLHD